MFLVPRSTVGRRPISRESAELLTPRQQQVIDLAELRDADIALALGISVRTVNVLMAQVLDRLRVETRTAAALKWARMRCAECPMVMRRAA